MSEQKEWRQMRYTSPEVVLTVEGFTADPEVHICETTTLPGAIDHVGTVSLRNLHAWVNEVYDNWQTVARFTEDDLAYIAQVIGANSKEVSSIGLETLRKARKPRCSKPEKKDLDE